MEFSPLQSADCSWDWTSRLGVTLASCFEAGRDGFWLHRLLTDNGVVNHVVEPTSILVTRGARRAKTDRLDAQGLLPVLAAAFAGDREICRMVRTPSVAEEDDKTTSSCARISRSGAGPYREPDRRSACDPGRAEKAVVANLGR
jgi:hypothetical protein